MPGSLGLEPGPGPLQLILTVGHDESPDLAVGDIRLTEVRKLRDQFGIGPRGAAGEVVSRGSTASGPGADDPRAGPVAWPGHPESMRVTCAPRLLAA